MRTSESTFLFERLIFLCKVFSTLLILGNADINSSIFLFSEIRSHIKCEKREVSLRLILSISNTNYLNNESTKLTLLNNCKSSIASPTPIYFIGILN